MRTALFGAVLLALGGLALVTGVLPAKDAATLGARVWPILLFVIAITVVAELATAAGLFDWIAGLAARWGRRRGWLLWLLIALIAVVSTVFLSLDTTAVLLTPIVIVLARRVGLNPLPFALTTVWLANTASLLLPVSNLTNLLAEQHLGGIGPAAFAAAVWPAQLAGVVVPLALVAVLFRRDLAMSYDDPGPVRLADRRLTSAAGVVLVLLVVGLVSGVAVWIPGCAAAVVLVIAFALLRPRELSVRLLPWPTLLLVCGLFLLVAALGAAGPGALLERLVPSGDGLPALLGVAAIGATAANVTNNLPAYLALEPTVHGLLPGLALLIGVNAGPLITPWASLATLLWHERVRRLGVGIRWSRYVLYGCLLAPVTVVLAVAALWVVKAS
ncbi:arsenic transporter [Gryllotalpicola protaetiae]|uniref:Arsenic transporter n=1 Tax=Gryllotalpicola protaetiae TaxID=2419771 RepID=A0A387BVQ1_9MICO|nr:arsenic transporter [Gryllotalpicola protaetiae]